MLLERRFKEAASFAELQVYSSGESSTFWLNQQAIALLKWGRYKEAASVAERALTQDPKGYYSLLIRSEAQLKQGAATEALAGFQEAATYQSVKRRARKGIVESLLVLRRFDDTLGMLNGWDGDPLESFPYRVKALSGTGRDLDAMAACREWLLSSPDNRQALWLLCELECRVDGFDVTLAKYEKMAKIPSRPPIYGELCAMLYRKSGNIDGAIGQYNRLAGTSGDPSIARRKIFALAKNGREAEALPLLEELLRADPADQYAHNAYVAAARRMRYLDSVWKFYHELLGRFPDQKHLYGRLKKLGKDIETATTLADGAAAP